MTDVKETAERISTERLEPCPFCGEMPEVRGSVIGCKNLNCWGPSIWNMSNLQDSAAAWNRRASRHADAQEGEEVEMQWRDLALQFDGHRIECLSMLRYISEAKDSFEAANRANEARAFLDKPPLSGEAVLAERIAALNPRKETVGACIAAIQAERDKPIEGPEHGAWDRGKRDGLTKAIKILAALSVNPQIGSDKP